jgi:hypothetical protein
MLQEMKRHKTNIQGNERFPKIQLNRKKNGAVTSSNVTKTMAAHAV